MRNFLITLTFLIISSCGFHAIYNDNKISKNSQSYNQELASIKVHTIRKKINQDLKNNLEKVLNPDDIVSDPKYLMEFTLDRIVTSTFTVSSGSTGRNKVTLMVSYKLKDFNSGELISTGSTTAKDDFNVSDNRFANYITEESIATNLTLILAQNIRNLLINDIVNSYKIKEIPERENLDAGPISE